MKPTKLLVICGPTATGKTKLGLDIARQFNGEIISADSRQVYIGMDIVTGKDLPSGAVCRQSDLIWQGRHLKCYDIDETKIWLYDIVYPNEEFSVSHWHDCAVKVIHDISSRGKLPIVVGGTGLYIKSLTHRFESISVPKNPQLRAQLAHLAAPDLFAYLSKVDPFKAAKLNQSDRSNPRRLIRAIEIGVAGKSLQTIDSAPPTDHLLIGLTGPKSKLYSRVDRRIQLRLARGAKAEAKTLSLKYGSKLPSFSACGYLALLSEDSIKKWEASEHGLIRRQLTWFKRQPSIIWFDIIKPECKKLVQKTIAAWYNGPRNAQTY